ncbi:MAG: tyrosine--tRNA ligase [Clostridia bacterium]|nr:tyrosine--tRNA ligase [Clostridia bacterium]
MENVFDLLSERGFIEQSTNEEEVRELLGRGPVTFYIGFDPTADSLHVGHFIQVMVMMHMQRAGHRPIALIGGGTTMVGDPSGRTDLRQMLTQDEIARNGEKFKKTFSRFLRFDDRDGAIMVNNADWLLPLNYIDFLREVGRYFSVNRMLTAECYKSRLEQGLTFLEFNYMLMQSYDFLELYRRYGALLQLGGNDQWSNILAGADLIRRVEGAEAHALTFKLLTTAAGKKMGKTESGAVWLDAEKTSPYEFYQYWRNIDDADVANCLALLTFIPMEQVRAMTDMAGGADINRAKEKLAYEVTKLVHSEEEAVKSQNAARALFGGGGITDDMPTTLIERAALKPGFTIIDLLTACQLIASNSDGRRLIKDGGIYLNNERVASHDQPVSDADFADGQALLRKGKKIYHKAILR